MHRNRMRLAVVWVGLATLATLLSPAPLVAAPMADGAPLWRSGGQAAAVAMQDGVTYALVGMKLLAIDMATGTVLGELSFEYRPVDLVVAGDYAYVACDGYAAVHSVDIRDPAAMVREGGDRLSMGATALALKVPYLYVFGRAGDEMLMVYDVSDPAALEEEAALTLTKYVARVQPGADHLYVLSTLGHVGAIDISTRTAPAEASWFNAYALEGDLVVAEPRVYVAGMVFPNPGIYVIDAANPDNLQQLGTWRYTSGGDLQGMAVQGDHLFVGLNNSGNSGLFVLDVANPVSISRVGVRWQTQGFYRFALDGTTLTVAAGDDGDVATYSVATPTAPQLSRVLELPGVAEQVAWVGDVAYARVAGDHGGSVNGLYVYDVSNPPQPRAISVDDGTLRVADFAVAGGTLYLCHTGGLSLRGATDLWNLVGSYVMDNGYCTAVAVAGTTAYMLGAPDDLLPVDIANPAAPAPAAGVALSGSPQAALVREGNRLYAVEGAVGFNTIGIGSPLTPGELGQSTVATIGALAVDGATAYAGTAAGLQMLNVSGTGATPITAVGTLNAVQGVDVVDDRAYIAGDNFARVLDVSTPISPAEIWASDATEPGRDIAGAGNWALVAGGEAGLRLYLLAAGLISSGGGDRTTIGLEEALVVTFAEPMDPATVTYTCEPDPGGWQLSWAARVAVDANQVLTLQHAPFTVGDRVTFTITGGQTAAGSDIAPFSATFDVIELSYVYLPLVVR